MTAPKHEPRWLSADELRSWIRFTAVLELLPGVLDSQLQRDAGLTHFDYFVLAMLSEAPDRTLRMSGLAARTNATLSRLSHVVSRLEDRGFVERHPSRDDRRATDASMTETGWRKLVATAPSHVETVRTHVIDALSAEQVESLGEIAGLLLQRLDPTGRMTSSID